MLRKLHHLMVTNPVTRRPHRAVVRGLKRVVGCPDAFDDLARLCRKVRPEAILDVGAHEGHTVDRLLEASPTQTIHAFEPTPESFEVLRRRMAGRANVHVHPLAVSDKTGRLAFHVNVGSETNSLLDNAGRDERPFEHQQEHLRKVEVDAVRLDDWVPQHVPSGWIIIKSDIQGAERLLVAGARSTLAERVAGIYCEICLLPLYEGQTTFSQLHEVLSRELGFALYNIYPCGRDDTGRAAWTDALWVKESLALPL